MPVSFVLQRLCSECRTAAKFNVRMLLIYLGLQNDGLSALLQHGKLFASGTGSNQEKSLQTRPNGRSAELRRCGLFLAILFQVAVQAGPADAQNLCGTQAIS